jgi:hypothetical protein
VSLDVGSRMVRDPRVPSCLVSRVAEWSTSGIDVDREFHPPDGGLPKTHLEGQDGGCAG